MPNYTLNLYHFLVRCESDTLQDAYKNEEYAKAKKSGVDIVTRLLATIPLSQRDLAVDYLDAWSELYMVEVRYYYLCGMRDAYEPKEQPETSEIPVELASSKRYSSLRTALAKMREELDEYMSDEFCHLLHDYIQILKFVTGIDKTHSYSGGLRDKKRLDSLFDLSSAKKWRTFLHEFL